VFIRLFKTMFIHKGRSDDMSGHYRRWRLFMLTGNDIEETVCTEVACTMRQLRSRTSMLLVHGNRGRLVIWNGAKSLSHTRQIAKHLADQIKRDKAPEFYPADSDIFAIDTMEEGKESGEFFESLGGTNRDVYHSLLNSNEAYNFTPRIFQFTSTNGNFEANELFYALRTKELASPYPFTQAQLYKSRQPTIFMIDNGHILWLWQGWWPQEDGIGGSGSSGNDSDGSGSSSPGIDNRSGENRWQAERRAAMETAVTYWQAKMKVTQPPSNGVKKNGHSHKLATNKLKRQASSASSSSTCSIASSASSISDDGLDEVDQDQGSPQVMVDQSGPNKICDINGYIVWAGLEPIQFKSMFPDWEDRDDIAEINIQVSWLYR
jgi:supervillin